MMTGITEGIHPTFHPEYIRRTKARMEKYQNATDEMIKEMTSKEREDYFNEICEGIGSVATGLDNPPRKRKKLVRSIDETWEGG